jgi:hypothetical protein
MVEPVVGAGAELPSLSRFHCGTVSYCLVGVGAGVVSPFGVDLGLGVAIGVDVGAGAGFGFGFGCGIGTDLSCLPGCGCWRNYSIFGSPVCVRSGCIEASWPTPL